MSTVLARRLDKIQQVLAQKEQTHLTRKENSVTIHADSGDIVYNPTKTGELFHNCTDSVRLMMGPFGSGKTTACLMEMPIRACLMPRSPDGVRRSKWAIIRNTSGQLTSTTLESWLKWASQLGHIESRQKPNLEYKHTFNDGDGVVELRLIFLPLDLLGARGKLLSLELTGAYLNELSELRSYVLTDVIGRIGRYPWPEGEGEPYWTGVIADTNPPPTESWIYEKFEKKKLTEHSLFKQPPGLLKDEDGTWLPNIHADNYQRLGDKYYMRMTHGSTEEWIKVYCCGEWGIFSDDKAVYSTYNDDIHSGVNVEAVAGVPLVLGFDFGLTPACVVEQLLPNGQLIMVREFISPSIMGLRTFLDNHVMPGLARHFNGFDIEAVACDPAGSQRAQADSEAKTCIEILEQVFDRLIVKPSWSNIIARRLDAVEITLNRLVDGQAAFVLNRKYCNTIRTGFIGKYCYKKILRRDGDAYTEVPDKNEYSHPHDAHQYACMYFFENHLKSQGQNETSVEEVKGFRLVNADYYRRR